jgi:hypothetical protein
MGTAPKLLLSPLLGGGEEIEAEARGLGGCDAMMVGDGRGVFKFSFGPSQNTLALS